jgi:hypothetical protein
VRVCAEGLSGGGYTWAGWIKDVAFVASSAPLLWHFLSFLRDHKGRVPFGPSVWAVAPLVLAALGTPHLLLPSVPFTHHPFHPCVLLLLLLCVHGEQCWPPHGRCDCWQ